MSGACTIHDHSLSVVVNRFRVFDLAGLRKTVHTFSLVCLFSGVAIVQLMLCWCRISFTGEYTCCLAVGPSSMTKKQLAADLLQE